MKQLAITLAAVLMASGGANADPFVYKLPRPEISETHSLDLKSAKVMGSKMTYLEAGEGEAVVFVHGNPTSSYLWRNVIPYVSEGYRAIAPDLIGMGGSDKPDIAYTFEDHRQYFEGFIESLGLSKVTLVGHDWGAALAWDYARRNPKQVDRLAFMEGVLPPTFPQPSFEAMGEEMGGMFRAFKDEVQGHEMVIKNNMFVEEVLPGFVSRPLGEEARSVYGAPYVKEADRAPTLAWPREVPIAGAPPSTVNALTEISAFMGETQMPVLLLYADPGVVTPPAAVPWFVEKIENIETGFVGQGLHFIQEDQPDAIGREVADWLRRTEN